MATFFSLGIRPLSSRDENGSFEDKYDVMLSMVSSYMRKYLLKCFGAIVGTISSKNFSTLGIELRDLKVKGVNVY